MQRVTTPQAISRRLTDPARSWLLASLVLVSAASLLWVAQAWGDGHKTVKCPYMEAKRAEGQCGCWKALSSKLDLTEEQADKIQSIQTKYSKDASKMKEAIRAKKASLDQMFRDPNASDKEILAMQQEVADLKLKKMEASMNARLQARSVLDDEQIRNMPAGCSLGMMDKGHCGKGYGKEAGCCGKCTKGTSGKAPCGRHKGHPL